MKEHQMLSSSPVSRGALAVDRIRAAHLLVDPAEARLALHYAMDCGLIY